MRSGIARSLRIASDLNIGDTVLREWVHRAKAGAGNGVPGALTSDEREELSRLRREHKRVLMDLEILKKAAVSSTSQRNTGLDPSSGRLVSQGSCEVVHCRCAKSQVGSRCESDSHR